MIHTILAILPTFVLLASAGVILMGLAWWACIEFEAHDTWLIGDTDEQ